MKDFRTYKLNVIKSPYDPRDFVFSSIYKSIEIPVKVDYRDNLFSIRDQGSQGTCAAMAGAAMKEWQEIKDIKIQEYLSPQFIYNNRKDLDEDGMTNRDLMKILQEQGVCLESSFKYGTMGLPPIEAIEQALLFKINNYARIYTLNELKQAIFIKGPGIIAVPVYNYTDRMWHQNSGDEFLGGHDMCYAGYDDELDCLWIRNSWGTEFAEGGYVKMSYQDFGDAWEWWSTVDLPSTYPPIEPIDPIDPPEPEKKGCWGQFWNWANK